LQPPFRLRPQQFKALRSQIIGKRIAADFSSSGLDISFDAAGLRLRDPAGRDTLLSFDDKGFLSDITSPMGRVWHIENNHGGRPIRMTNPAGQRLDMRYDDSGQLVGMGQGSQVFRLSYTQERLESIDYPDGTSIRILYDAAGRMTAATDRLGNTETFRYGPDGKLASLADGNGNRTTSEFGAHGVTALHYPDGSSERYEYDSDGRMRRIFTGGDLHAEIQHDADGRRIAFADGQVLRMAYDAGGKLASAAVSGEPDSEVRFAYDAEGRVVAEFQGAHSVRYTYNTDGAVVGLTYPSGGEVRFSYDKDLRLDGVTDWNGGVCRIDYASDFRGMAFEMPNGLSTRVAASERGMPDSMVTKHRSRPEPLFSFRCRYDGENRLGVFEDSTFGRTEYRYDKADRLLGATRQSPAETEEFAYDGAGNRVRSNGRRAEYDPLNQLLRHGETSCQYDRRGNLLFRQGNGESWRYRYNHRNLLVGAESSAGTKVTFAYDALGRRIRKSAGSKVVRYTWAGEQLIGEVATTPSGTTVVDYLYLPETYIPLAARVNGKVYFFHPDHLGTPRRVTDERGEVAWSADFSAFGNARIAVEAVSNQLRFPSQYFDEETGLHYNRSRYYSPEFGCYLSRDPQGFAGGLNLYTYAAGDPVNHDDPLGMWTWSGVLTTASRVTAVIAGVAAGAAVGLALAACPPLAILAGGAVAGGIIGGLNEYIDQDEFSLGCIWSATWRGAVSGAASSLPFVLALALPAEMGIAAGILAFMALGAAAGAIGYTVDWLLTPGAKWDWGWRGWNHMPDGFLRSVLVGAALGGLLRAAGKYLESAASRALSRAGITNELPGWLKKILPDSMLPKPPPVVPGMRPPPPVEPMAPPPPEPPAPPPPGPSAAAADAAPPPPGPPPGPAQPSPPGAPPPAPPPPALPPPGPSAAAADAAPPPPAPPPGPAQPSPPGAPPPAPSPPAPPPPGPSAATADAAPPPPGPPPGPAQPSPPGALPRRHPRPRRQRRDHPPQRRMPRHHLRGGPRAPRNRRRRAPRPRRHPRPHRHRQNPRPHAPFSVPPASTHLRQGPHPPRRRRRRAPPERALARRLQAEWSGKCLRRRPRISRNSRLWVRTDLRALAP